MIATLVAGVVLPVAGYFWLRHQIGRTANALLVRADELERQEDWVRATTYVSNFVGLRRGTPEADRALQRLAELTDKSASDGRGKSRAVSAYYRALGVAPADEAIAMRNRLLELLLELGRYAEAERECLTQLEALPEDAATLRIYALSLYGQVDEVTLTGNRSQEVSVGEQLERALKANPGNIELTFGLTRLFRARPQLLSGAQRKLFATTERRHEKADELMDQVVQHDPESSASWLARYRYRKLYDVSGAGEDLQTALAKGPDDLNVRLAAATAAEVETDDDARRAALEHYQYVLDHIDDKNEFAYLGIGNCHVRDRNIDEAMAAWQRGLDKLGPDNWVLNVQMARALLDCDRWDDADARIKIIERQLAQASAARDGDLSRPVLRAREEVRDLLRLRWQINQGEETGNLAQVQRAIPTLERLHQVGLNRDEALPLLGLAYSALRQWDSAARAYDEVVKLYPKKLNMRAAAANCWLAAGQPDEAELRYESLTAASNASESWLMLGLARLQVQVRVPAGHRNWTKFNSAVARAESFADKDELLDPWRLTLLKADHLFLASFDAAASSNQPTKTDDAKPAPTESPEAAGKRIRGEAIQLLLAAEQQYSDNTFFLRRLVPAYSRLGERDAADRVLAKLDASDVPAAEVALIRAKVLMSREQMNDAELLLKQTLAEAPERWRGDLQRELVRVSVANGKREDAVSRLRDMVRDSVADAEDAFLLGEYLLNDDKLDEAQAIEDKVRELESTGGTRWKVLRARRLLIKSKDKSDPSLIEVGRLLKNVTTSRPKWFVGHALTGILADQQGDLPAATAAYRRAVEYGDRNPSVLKRLFLLLRENVADAEQYLALIGDPGRIDPELAGVRISVAEQRGQHEQAINLARVEAERRPNDATAQYWLGSVLLNNYDPSSPLAEASRAEAFAALSKAAQLDPKSPQFWGGLFAYQLRTGEVKKARDMIDQVDDLAEMSPAERLSLKAQCFRMLRDRKESQRLYEEAIKLEPVNADFHRQLAEYLVWDDPQRATEHLREAMRLDPNSDQIRRTLAAALLALGGQDEWEDAQKLLTGPDARATSDADLRLKARAYLMRRGSENLRKAREILERLKNGPNATSADHLMLAQAYELTDMDVLARETYRSLAARDSAQPGHVATYADFLLRRDLYSDALPWIENLQTRQPNNPAHVQLRARWLRGQGRAGEVDAMIDQFAERVAPNYVSNEARARLYRGLGELASQAGRYATAERWFRQAVELAPEYFPGLAFALAQQNRPQEAVAVCEAAALSIKTTQPAIVACEVLLLGQLTAADYQTAEPLIAQVLASQPDDPKLLVSLATLRFIQHRIDEATELYRKVAQIRPNDLIALNNLATLLGEQPGRGDEALGYIDRAIKHGGQQPALLDTKGTILIHQGKAQQAIPLLEAATHSLTPDPRYHFHLAVAFGLVGQPARARPALKRALDLGLQAQVLTESDRRLWSDLERQLAAEKL